MTKVEQGLVEIPAGAINLRDDRTKEVWTVEVAPFLLAKHPMTQELYFEITGVNPSTFQNPMYPVESISWKEAIECCNQLSLLQNLQACYDVANPENIVFNPKTNGYRLPSEAEWEYACKAGVQGIRYGELDDIAWYKANSSNHPQPVGLKQPNPFGLYDMLGNVWEWCSDIYDATVYGSYRIIRGGGWCDEARGVMATNRRRSHPTAFRIDDLGFRLARNIR